MNFGCSMFFFQFGLGGAGVQIVERRAFFWEVLWWKHLHMKNIQNNNGKKSKKFRPMGKVWGEAWQGTWVWTLCFCFFWFFHGFLQFGQNFENTKKKFRPMGEVWAIHTQTKTKNKKKNKIAHPKGRGSDAECWVLSFCFFFVFFCVFFVFLVCAWIAIADVPSRDCQALSVVALEARSIHYSTAMVAMT